MPSEATSNTILFLTVVAEYMATARTCGHELALGPLLQCPEIVDMNWHWGHCYSVLKLWTWTGTGATATVS